jgi:hypothetical protein
MNSFTGAFDLANPAGAEEDEMDVREYALSL